MKPKPIGIIGGAGPMAGAFLLERVLCLSSQLYGCYKDSDFPKIILISFPFSDMLDLTIDVAQVRFELSQTLNQLRNNGASILAIACNTLHVFLDEKEEPNDLIHLPRVVAQEIDASEKPLVFCTSTSAQFGLHKRFFPCNYPSPKIQSKVDNIIDQILKGIDKKTILERLTKLIASQSERTVVLGCTELSLFTQDLTLINKKIIDPLELVANKILKNSFAI